ncbi:glutathione peroxidase [Clostridia bacterium]|nr:glutathione peroxidase [Clostridia bacterium]
MSVHNFTYTSAAGQLIPLSDYAGKVLLIVNTATHCGFTPQLEGLQKLYDDFRDKGFEIIAFPCNQFGGQAPGSNEEISEFCSLKFHTTFPQSAKIEVNGENEDPLFAYLKSRRGGVGGANIKWNFTKFLVDKNGEVAARFSSLKKPEAIAADIEKLLA